MGSNAFLQAESKRCTQAGATAILFLAAPLLCVMIVALLAVPLVGQSQTPVHHQSVEGSSQQIPKIATPGLRPRMPGCISNHESF